MRNIKKLSLVLVSGIIFSLLLIGCSDNKNENDSKVNDVPTVIITFSDANLEKVIRVQINKPTGDIFKSDVEKITSLKAESLEITNLSGIENLTSLNALDLDSNQISNIESLKGLTKMNSLDLNDNQISNLEPLEGLINLTRLGLSYNYNISNIEPLRGLTNLTVLGLSPNEINDYTPVSSYYKNLKGKDFTLVANAPIANTEVITFPDKALEKVVRSNIGKLTGDITKYDVVNLTELIANKRKITNISGIENLTNLTALNLSENQITDIEPLRELTNLTQLALSGNQISNIEPLKTLSNLSRLYLESNKISDIEPLRGLTNLSYLFLDSNQIKDYAPVKSYFNNLQEKDFTLE